MAGKKIAKKKTAKKADEAKGTDTAKPDTKAAETSTAGNAAKSSSKGNGPRLIQILDTQAPVRSVVDWTAAKLKQAEQQANSGNLTLAAQCAEWILGEDRVGSGLDSRIEQLLGNPVSFDFTGGVPNDRILQGLQEEGDFYVSYPESEQAEFLRWGIVLGVAPGKHRWTEYRGRRMPDPEFWHPSALRYSYDQPRQWLIKDSEGLEHSVVPGDSEWILHMPFGRNRPWLRGLWRSLGRWVLLKYYAMSDWSRHGDASARFVLTTENEDVQDEQRRQLAEDIFASAKESVIALAYGCDLKLLEASANTEAIYNAQINAANAAIAIRIRGGNLTTEVKEGSKAAAQVQVETGDMAKARFDGQMWSTTLHDQSLNWYSQFNFNAADDTPYPKWSGDRYKESSARADTLTKVGQAVSALRPPLKGTGKKLNVLAIYNDFNIPTEDGEDEALIEDEEDDEIVPPGDDAPPKKGAKPPPKAKKTTKKDPPNATA